MGKSFLQFRNVLPTLSNLIETRSIEAIKTVMKDFEDHQLGLIISEQGEEMLETKTLKLETTLFREETNKDMEEMAANFHHRIENLMEMVEVDRMERRKAQDEKEELREATEGLEEIRNDISEVHDEFVTFAEKFEEFQDENDDQEWWDDVSKGSIDEVLDIVGGSAITLCIGCVGGLVRKIFKKE